MGLSFGNVLGAATSVMGGFGGNSSLKEFISTMDSMGVQITSRYEALFSAIPQSTFFIQNISTPSIKLNITNLYYDGRLVEIPLNYEYEHDFSMTVINDASGFIYSALINFVMSDSSSFVTDNGYTMTIRAIGDNNTDGSLITLNGVKIKSVGGLSFNHSGGEVQTFDVQCSAVDFSAGAGATSGVSGVLGAVSNLLG